MYPQVFEIDLDQESRRFIAGQIISGRVILVLQKEKAVKGICLRLLGKGYVSWEGGISGLKYSHNVYTDSEIFVDIKTNLLYREDGKEQLLEPGRHQYNFSIQLPPSIPSSIETQYGYIKYSLEASIQRSWKEDYTSVIPNLIIRGLIDLNAEPKAGEPVKIFKEKHVGIMLCQNGPLTVNFLLSKAGFVPGEYLQFSLEVRNGANVKISSVIISLRSHMTYKVGNEKKSQAEKVVQCLGPSVEMKGFLIWQNHFQIPDLPPNPLDGCKIMELKYYLELKLVIERWSDLKICTPLVIGSIPYSIPEIKTVNHVKFPTITHDESMQNNHVQESSAQAFASGATNAIGNNVPLSFENPEYSLPCIDWGSSACLAEIEKITSRPVQTVPSFLLSASENLYAMSMGSCDKLSTNYEILDDRHILFEDEDAFVDMCSAQLQNMFVRGEENGHNHNKDFYG